MLPCFIKHLLPLKEKRPGTLYRPHPMRESQVTQSTSCECTIYVLDKFTRIASSMISPPVVEWSRRLDAWPANESVASKKRRLESRSSQD